MAPGGGPKTFLSASRPNLDPTHMGAMGDGQMGSPTAWRRTKELWSVDSGEMRRRFTLWAAAAVTCVQDDGRSAWLPAALPIYIRASRGSHRS